MVLNGISLMGPVISPADEQEPSHRAEGGVPAHQPSNRCEGLLLFQLPSQETAVKNEASLIDFIKAASVSPETGVGVGVGQKESPSENS